MAKNIIQREIEQAEMLENCSLYRAIRWIAFNEKPIEMDELYPRRVDVDIMPVSGEDAKYCYAIGEAWENTDDIKEFGNACLVLQNKLINGDIEAKGIGVSCNHGERNQHKIAEETLKYRRESDAKRKTSYVPIPKAFWTGTAPGDGWAASQAENRILDDIKYRAYVDIHLNCEEVLQRIFKENKKDLSEKERRSLLKLVIGIAKTKYKFDLTLEDDKKRSAVTGKIKHDLDILGLSLHEDTIRGYLKEGLAVLNEINEIEEP